MPQQTKVKLTPKLKLNPEQETSMNSKLPANVAAAANPAAVYGSVPGGAALIIYGFGTNAAGARPAENTPAVFERERNNKNMCMIFFIGKKKFYSEIGVGEERVYDNPNSYYLSDFEHVTQPGSKVLHV